AAAKGEITAGIELALNAAEVARHRGHAGFEIIALHDVVRLGAPARAVRRLAELATVVEGRLAPLYAIHAGALAAGDGTRLDAVAAAFAELGYLLLAAEAATQAAAAHRGAGYRTRAGASRYSRRRDAGRHSVEPCTARLDRDEQLPGSSPGSIGWAVAQRLRSGRKSRRTAGAEGSTRASTTFAARCAPPIQGELT
ncbi:MAG: hypothetical protein ACRDQJ_15465, partial [Pseudonocardiaceae bacterium]